MAYISGNLLGDKELEKAMAALPDALVNQALRQVLRDEAKQVKDLAQAKLRAEHMKTGRLARSLKVRTRRIAKRRGIGMNIETGTREELGIAANATGYYPASLEFGFLHARSGRKIPARSYMRSSLHQRESGMLARMQQAMHAALERVVARKISSLIKKL